MVAHVVGNEATESLIMSAACPVGASQAEPRHNQHWNQGIRSLRKLQVSYKLYTPGSHTCVHREAGTGALTIIGHVPWDKIGHFCEPLVIRVYRCALISEPVPIWQLIMFSKMHVSAQVTALPCVCLFVCYKTRADTAMSLRQARQKS